MSLVKLAYRRAKAVKAVKKALDSGKIVKNQNQKTKHSSHKTQSRSEEMREMFQNDMSEQKQKRRGGGGKKKSKHSFKSKSRYKAKTLFYLHFGGITNLDVFSIELELILDMFSIEQELLFRRSTVFGDK